MAHCSTCIDSADDSNIQGPLGVKYDDFEGHINVILVIPGIKKPRSGPFAGSTSSKGNTIVDAKFYDQSLRVDIQLVGGQSSTAIKYLYKIKQLPGKISPHLCTYKVGKNKITLNLQKASSGSWRSTLDSKGLETSDDY
uniref:CS domain-containing protein n=1 Tax=Romanomermis culicivorax TaxID=13658 RepID=A0A915KTH3_ROMCU